MTQPQATGVTGWHHAPDHESTPDLYIDYTAQAYTWYPSPTMPGIRVPVAMWSRGPRHARREA
ncbi:MAG TPA: hypothetical protein VF062_22310 [Candidatus Limnocylindrales bacterium]